jgi:hypothetical protein
MYKVPEEIQQEIGIYLHIEKVWLIYTFTIHKDKNLVIK